MSNSLFEFFKKFAIKIAVSILVSYNRFCIITRIKYRNARKTNPGFNSLCNAFDSAGEVIATGFANLICNKLVPSSPVWLSVCQYIPRYRGLSLRRTPDTKWQAFEDSLERFLKRSGGNLVSRTTVDDYSKFFDADVRTWDTDFGAQHYHVFKQTYRDVVNRSSWDTISYTDAIVVGQICPNYTIIKTIKNADTNVDLPGHDLDTPPPAFDIRDYIKPTSSRFLDIEYRCGNRSPIAIEVPKSHYLAGNELLSKTYILRYLEHLPIYVKWKFDESYSLRIVDDDSNVFSLDSNQYVLLGEDGYKIVNSDQEEEKIEPQNQDK